MPVTKPQEASTANLAVKKGTFKSDGLTLSYESLGVGPRVVVYLPGLLLNTGWNRRLAHHLAMAGNRVLLLDPPGHGQSDKPRDIGFHRMDVYARHVVHLLDHLDVEEAVIGGMSLGANIALHVAVTDPERVRGLVLEMPVLGRGMVPLASIIVIAVLAERTFPFVSRAIAKVGPHLPRTGNDVLDGILAETVTLQPEEIVAILHGLTIGPIAPTIDERRAITAPTLVLGVRGQIAKSHPFQDAADLVEEMPNSRLVTTTWLHELRTKPSRLTPVIIDFVDEVWAPRPPKRGRRIPGGRPIAS